MENIIESIYTKRERIESSGQTGGTRQDVHGGDRLLSVARTTRNNEDTITDVLRGLLHVKVALQLRLRESLFYDAGTMEESISGVGQKGNGGNGYGSSVGLIEENIDPKAIIDELIRCASTGESNPDLAERAKFISISDSDKILDGIRKPT